MSSQNDDNDDDGQHNNIPYRNRCCFIAIPQFHTTSSYTFFHRIKPPPSPSPTTTIILNHQPWWLRGWNKIRTVSEVVFGPKWKTFIRRFRRNRTGFLMIKGRSFQYDPLSYKLNFDDGCNDDDDGLCDRKFSTRFAPVHGNNPVPVANSGPGF